MVKNGSVLDEKIAALTAAMGLTPDFSKTYAEHFPEIDIPDDDPADDPKDEPQDNGGIGTLGIVLIIAGAVVVLAGAGFAAFILIKKSKASVSTPNRESDDASSEAEEK